MPGWQSAASFQKTGLHRHRFQRRLKCARPVQKLHNVAFVRLQPVQLDGRNRAEVQSVDVLSIDLTTFVAALQRENHTLKRTLTDPHVFSGIGNAYSDEILHAAKLSPFKQTSGLTDEEAARLFAATRSVLSDWIDRLQKETGDDFPEKVTAFREGMAVHGRYGKPCPVCGTPVQRIAYASNEANYCVTCQTGGRLLADRSLSRLLREDWPRTLEELERRRRL